MVTIGLGKIQHRGFYGDRGMDITVKSAGPIGKTFAPTWPLVMGLKNGKITWEEYACQYRNLMRASYRRFPDIWENVLSREQVWFLCYCHDERHCHRSLLRDYFLTLGAKAA